jgi:hypothetical protein
MPHAMLRLLFLVAGLYDFLIGLTFLFFGAPLLEWAGSKEPNHWGYLQFAALQLIIFGTMFLAVARDPVGNRNLIVYGLMLKVSYVSMVGYYMAQGACPFLFQPFAVIDIVMFVLFLWAYLTPQSSARPNANRV